MYDLALFAGAGGGCLASQHILGWQTLCYVEYEDYAAQVLQARIKDGLLHDVPIWSDVRSFTKRNNATRRFIRGLRQIRNELSRPDSHVSHSARQETNLGEMIREICGRTPSVSYAKYDRDTVCWRTFQTSLLTNTSSEFLGTWPKAGMIVDGLAYRLKNWERSIAVTGYGLLHPTSTTSVLNGGSNSRRTYKKRLMFPTPAARDWRGTSVNQKPRDTLDCAIELGQTKSKMYPTPVVYDSTPGGPNNHYNGLGKMAKFGVGMFSCGKKDERLNPRWVEWLMRWPVGWASSNLLSKSSLDSWLECSSDEPEKLAQKGKHHKDEIKCIGNGQDPFVAATAWRLLTGQMSFDELPPKPPAQPRMAKVTSGQMSLFGEKS